MMHKTRPECGGRHGADERQCRQSSIGSSSARHARNTQGLAQARRGGMQEALSRSDALAIATRSPGRFLDPTRDRAASMPFFQTAGTPAAGRARREAEPEGRRGAFAVRFTARPVVRYAVTCVYFQRLASVQGDASVRGERRVDLCSSRLCSSTLEYNQYIVHTEKGRTTPS